jgi:O-antigen ligase
MGMIKIQESEKIGFVIGILAACTTLAISPFYSYDSFSPIKLIFISALGAVSGFYVFKSLKNLSQRLGKFASVVIVSILLDLLIIFMISKVDISQLFYGISGRYTGFLTYLSLTLILTASAITSNFFVRKKILNCLIFCGLPSVIYSILQFSGRDFVDWDSTAGSQVIGFLGNPNFVSSFLALCSTAIFAKIIGDKNTLVTNFFYILMLIGIGIGLVGANSTQGFLIAILGFAVVLYFYFFYRFKSKTPSRITLTILTLGVIGGLLDIFQKAPWNPFLYGETISIRGDYWQAGWNMALANPVFGVGFDGYLNHYRRSRDFVAANRAGAEIPTDAAHNVLLDYASNGGFIFMILNLILLSTIFIYGLNYLRGLNRFDQNFVAIFAVWIGFTVQSIISINQLGLAVWGWVFGGLILGVKYAEKSQGDATPNNLIRKKRKLDADNFTLVIAIVALLGCIASLPVMLADQKFKLAVDSKKALDLYNSANSWPPITKKMVLVTAILNENKIYKEAKILSQRTLKINPDSFEGWIVYSQNPLVSELEMAEIKRQLLRLDPNILKFGGVDKYLADRLGKP